MSDKEQEAEASKKRAAEDVQDDEDGSGEDEEFEEAISGSDLSDSDDSSDEDVEESNKRRKRARKEKTKRDRPRGSRFIETEADVSEDEDEEEEEEELEAEPGFHETFVNDDDNDEATARNESRRLDIRTLRNNTEEEVAQKVKYFEERYRQSYRNEGRGYLDGYDGASVNPVALQPTGEDPKLFSVKCTPGRERALAFQLMRKFFAAGPQELRLISVVARDDVKGFIYVEAARAADVQQGCAKLNGLYSLKPQIIDLDEMIGALTVKKVEVKSVSQNQFVRLKKGKYSGDLAQVMSVDESRGTAVVRCIPRIDLQALKSEGREAPKRKRGFRPPQKMFNSEEIMQLGGTVLRSIRHRGFEEFGSDRFRDGFLYKDCSIESLNVSANPDLDEINKFSALSGGRASGLDSEGSRVPDVAMLSLDKTKMENSFQPGDVVEVAEGDLKNITGTVTKVDGDTVIVQPRHQDLQKPVSFSASQLRKFFRQSDHVKVIQGVHQHESGTVIHVKDNIATILTDVSLKEIQVFIKDIQLAKERTAGASALGAYQLVDFVNLDANTVGVVVRVERDTLTVLNQNGVLQTVKEPEIQSKRDDRRAGAMDAHQRTFHLGAQVKVMDGMHRGRMATVVHIFRRFIFLKSNEILENGGIFVVNSNVLNVLSSGSSMVNTNRAPPGAGLVPSTMFTGGAFGGRPPPRRGRDELLHQQVVVKQGPHKGTVGLVKSASDTHVQVEVQSRGRTITVDRSYVEPRNRSGTSGQAYDRFAGSRTPMYAGGRTPAYAGGMTPGYEGFQGGRTPAYVWDAGSRTPRAYDGHDDDNAPGTPYAPMDHATPRDDYMHADTPQTPHGHIPDTPGFVGTPSTPGVYYDSYATPATPGSHAPGTPAYYPPTYGGRTPGAPPTPASSRYDENDWVAEGLEVVVRESGRRGVVKSIRAGTINLALNDSSEQIAVPSYNVDVVAPSVRDRCMAIRGRSHGRVGTVKAISNNDVIVQFTESDVQMLPSSDVCKCTA